MYNNKYDIILGDFIEVNVPNYRGIQEWELIREPHDYAHIDFFTTRGGEITIEGKTYIEEENTILCLPKNKAYSSIVKKEKHQYYSFVFTYETGSENTNFPFPIIFVPKDPQYFLDKYKEAYNLSIVRPYGYKIKIREIIYDVLAKIIDEHYTRVDNDNGGYVIRKSVDYINKNFENPDLSLLDISRLSGITDTHFRRVFKKVYGVTPTKYINRLRLNKAKSMLSNTNNSVEEISFKCGFNNYSYFARTFKKSVGTTPLFYRRKNTNIEF